MTPSMHQAGSHPCSAQKNLKLHVRWIDVSSGKTLREAHIVVDQFAHLWGDTVFKIDNFELPPGAYSVIVAATDDDSRFDHIRKDGMRIDVPM